MQKTFSNFLLKCLEIIFLFKLFLMADINVAGFIAMGFCHLDIGHFSSLSILSCVHKVCCSCENCCCQCCLWQIIGILFGHLRGSIMLNVCLLLTRQRLSELWRLFCVYLNERIFFSRTIEILSSVFQFCK